MMKAIRVGVAALAFSGLVAQPMVANAGMGMMGPPKMIWHFHRHHAMPSGNAGTAIAVAWAFTFFLCAGMTVGQQDVYAKKHHTTVTGNDRLRGFVSCIIPPLGLARLDQHHQA